MIFGLLLILLGTPLAIYNWYAFYRIFFKKKNISWVPFFGGGCLAFGAYILQKPFWWIFFLFDFGCFPGFFYNFLLYKWIDPWIRRKHGE
jgi:hypothetical protein